jgi:hypothetical protein
MPVYGFSEDDAKRIGHAVKVVERSGPTLKTSGAVNDRGAAGVRIMIGKVGTAEWSKASSAVITLYVGPPSTATSRPTATAGTMVAHNIFATIPSSAYVAMSNNGFGWYAIAAECE